MDNRITMVTGGARGIGKAIALQFARAGDCVIIVDQLDKEGRELERELREYHQQSAFYPCDLKNKTEIDALIDTIEMKYNRLDVLINNAGISEFKPLSECTLDDFDRVLRTNLYAPFYLSKKFAQLNKTCKYGRIINIASTRHLMSEPHSEAYAASKGGLVSLTHALALSLSDQQITVNCISPGWIAKKAEGLTREDHLQHPSKRVGRPSDVANLCLFLAKEENDFINGENTIIDGGMTKKMIYIEE